MNEITDIVQPAQTKKSKNKTSFEDIKKKLPINFPIISEINDLNKISQKRKSNSQNKGNNTKLLTINNSISSNSKNGRSPVHNNNKRKHHSQLQNNNINNISNTNTKNNTNINGSFNINMIDENDKRRIAYEFIMDIFKSKFPIQNEEAQKNNNNNEKNSYYSYDPERFKTENQELAKYDNNCNYENVYKIDTKNQKKKQSHHVDLNKNHYDTTVFDDGNVEKFMQTDIGKTCMKYVLADINKKIKEGDFADEMDAEQERLYGEE
jgi:hypothetical protein